MTIRRLSLILLAAGALLFAGCWQKQAPSSSALDEPLLSYLSMARVLHHEADLAEDQGKTEEAIQALERLLAKPKPRAAPEIDEVHADAWARLAELRSRVGSFDQALTDVKTGLVLVPNVSFYRGHLFEIRGLIYERQSKALTAKSDLSGAESARKLAMTAYEEAITIHGEIIARDSAKPSDK